MPPSQTGDRGAPTGADTRHERPRRDDAPVESLLLSNTAAARIAARINSGELRPGEKLPSERTLAAELDVSRPGLREALRTLQSAGLVQSRQRSGWYVTAHGSDAGANALVVWMQLQPTGDIVAVRRILEPEAIRAIPATRVAELAAICEGTIDEMRAALRRGEFDLATELHTRFHRELVQYAPTRLLRTLLASMIDAVSSAQREIFRTPRAGMHSLERHVEIVQALQAGDIEETARRVDAHLEPTFTFPRGGGEPAGWP